MDAQTAFRLWCIDVGRGSIEWSPTELRDFWDSSHKLAKANPLSSGTRHIDGTCPAHAYARCQCSECDERPRHHQSPQKVAQTAQSLEADRQADLAALAVTLAKERAAELATYAMEYDEPPASTAPTVKSAPGVSSARPATPPASAKARQVRVAPPVTTEVPQARVAPPNTVVTSQRPTAPPPRAAHNVPSVPAPQRRTAPSAPEEPNPTLQARRALQQRPERKPRRG